MGHGGSGPHHGTQTAPAGDAPRRCSRCPRSGALHHRVRPEMHTRQHANPTKPGRPGVSPADWFHVEHPARTSPRPNPTASATDWRTHQADPEPERSRASEPSPRDAHRAHTSPPNLQTSAHDTRRSDDLEPNRQQRRRLTRMVSPGTSGTSTTWPRAEPIGHRRKHHPPSGPGIRTIRSRQNITARRPPTTQLSAHGTAQPLNARQGSKPVSAGSDWSSLDHPRRRGR